MAVSINLSEIDEMKRLTTESSSKVQIVAAAHKTLSHLPQRPAVDLAFVDLNYRVREGRSNSEYISVHSFFFWTCRYCVNLKMINRPARRPACCKLIICRCRSWDVTIESVRNNQSAAAAAAFLNSSNFLSPFIIAKCMNMLAITQRVCELLKNSVIEHQLQSVMRWKRKSSEKKRRSFQFIE